MAEYYKGTTNNGVPVNDGSQTYKDYVASGRKVVGSVYQDSPSSSKSTGNSIGTGYTPTSSGASRVASSGLGGGGGPTSRASSNTVTKQNAYYTPGDAQSAQKLSEYYNLVPYTSGMQINDGVVVGGSAVIPDSAIQGNVTRLAGYDADGTSQQVSSYLKNLSSVTSEQYMQMSPDQLTESIQVGSKALTMTVDQMQGLIKQAMSDQNAANVAPILDAYTKQMESFWTSYLQQAQNAYNNGMNDPGLVQAVAMIRDEASVMRQQLDEELNARNMSQSGIYISSMNDFNKGVLSTEQTAISAHLSELNKNLQEAMTTVLNQRVAAMTQFAGIASQAEIQNASNQVQMLTAAISGLGSLAQVQQAGVNNAYDNMTSLVNNSADNATSRANNAASIAQSNIESLRNDATRRAELTAQINQYTEQNKLDAKKLEELIRSNKASEAIQLIAANAQARSAEASYLNARNGGSNDGLTAAQILGARQTAVEHSQYVASNLSGLAQQLEEGKITGDQILANGEDYYRKMYGIPAENNYAIPDRDTDAENLQLKILFDKAKEAKTTAANTSTSPWWAGDSLSASPAYGNIRGGANSGGSFWDMFNNTQLTPTASGSYR